MLISFSQAFHCLNYSATRKICLDFLENPHYHQDKFFTFTRSPHRRKRTRWWASCYCRQRSRKHRRIEFCPPRSRSFSILSGTKFDGVCRNPISNIVTYKIADIIGHASFGAKNSWWLRTGGYHHLDGSKIVKIGTDGYLSTDYPGNRTGMPPASPSSASLPAKTRAASEETAQMESL